MKILTFSTLFPNDIQHRHGIFVQNRLRKLLATGQVESKVVAPVPWFPFKSKRWGLYGEYAQVAGEENRFDSDIIHPRYLVIPKIGMNITPVMLAIASYPVLKRIIRDGYDFDVIDAHYFYPDGVAATLLGRWLGKPVVITARGSDVTQLPNYPLPKKMILWAAKQAAASITVCRALKEHLSELGADESKINVLRNGVDLEMFHPSGNREAVRERLKLDKPTLLSVGLLIERKGHHLVIEAMRQLPDYDLLIAGDGEEKQRLTQLVKSRGLEQRVRFLGTVTQQELVPYYQAVDALVLASANEGLANVLLETMACGTPVVATAVDGTPEVVAAPEAGVLMSERSTEALVQAAESLFAAYPDRQATRRYAEQFSWDATTQGQIDLFNKIKSQVSC